MNGQSRNHLAYTKIYSLENLPRNLRHPIVWVGMINKATPIKGVPKYKVGLDTITTSYPVGWIKSIRKILD